MHDNGHWPYRVQGGAQPEWQQWPKANDDGDNCHIDEEDDEELEEDEDEEELPPMSISAANDGMI